MTQDEPLDAEMLKTLEKERHYLEGLFNSRFNFYLVFVSLYFVAILGNGTPFRGGVWPVVLTVGTAASLLMFLAILRTHALLTPILKRLREQEKSGYQWAYNRPPLWRPIGEGNFWLLLFPALNTGLLGYLLVQSLKGSVPPSP